MAAPCRSALIWPRWSVSENVAEAEAGWAGKYENRPARYIAEARIEAGDLAGAKATWNNALCRRW
jgi:hypothetical protein